MSSMSLFTLVNVLSRRAGVSMRQTMSPFNSILCVVFVFEFGYKAFGYQHMTQQKRLQKYGDLYTAAHPALFTRFESENGPELLDDQ